MPVGLPPVNLVFNNLKWYYVRLLWSLSFYNPPPLLLNWHRRSHTKVNALLTSTSPAPATIPCVNGAVVF